MIDQNTTNVYVRVNAANRKVIAVSDEQLVGRPGKPIFNVVANFARLDYYVVVEDAQATHGFTVRGADSAEQTAADDALAARILAARQQGQARQQVAIKDFYDKLFIVRFYQRAFGSTAETMAASTYDGTDEHMLNVVKPLAIQIQTAYNDWRHTVCQTVIDDMFTNDDLGPVIDAEYTNTINDDLDTFLTDHGFDTDVYKR